MVRYSVNKECQNATFYNQDTLGSMAETKKDAIDLDQKGSISTHMSPSEGEEEEYNNFSFMVVRQMDGGRFYCHFVGHDATLARHGIRDNQGMLTEVSST